MHVTGNGIRLNYREHMRKSYQQTREADDPQQCTNHPVETSTVRKKHLSKLIGFFIGNPREELVQCCFSIGTVIDVNEAHWDCASLSLTQARAALVPFCLHEIRKLVPLQCNMAASDKVREAVSWFLQSSSSENDKEMVFVENNEQGTLNTYFVENFVHRCEDKEVSKWQYLRLICFLGIQIDKNTISLIETNDLFIAV